jgi:PAS domain S-box-containing protein
MKEQLLVLDDEALILKSLENLFEDDYEVFATSDGATALGYAREKDIAVILCDERMPGMSGHEFLRRAREVSNSTRLMMSGYADMSALTEAVNNGQIFAYIAKPWEPLKLKALVAAATVHFKLIQQVQQERELLRALMENIPDLIFFKDCQARFTRVNRALARTLGVEDCSECIGKSDSDYFEAEAAGRWRRQDAEIVRSGQALVDQLDQLPEPLASPRWISVTKVPMFDHAGKVSGIAGISRDITVMKQTEEMLREQSERNRMILETAKDAFVGMDPDGSITAWNPQAELTFGWAAPEVMGHRFGDTVVATECRGALANGVEPFLAGARISPLNQTIELVAVHRDSHRFPVEVTMWPATVGGACSFNAFVRDISERRRAEEAKRREAALIELLQSVTVAANSSSTIERAAQLCLDRICSHTGWPLGHVYRRANNSTPELTSSGCWYTAAGGGFDIFREKIEACGTSLAGSILASGKPEWIANLAEVEPLSERTCAAVEAGIRSAFAFPVLVDGDVLGVLEFFSLETIEADEGFLTMMGNVGSQLEQVIIRQRVEEDLKRARAAAESANLAKSEFLSTMSHEMRTPMNAILGMADMLSEGPLGDAQREHVRIFQDAGASLLDLINDILDLSKVESGHLELESIAFELGPFLKKIIELMSSRAHNRGLSLSLKVSPNVPAELVGDPKRLRQILLNLIGNALRFTEHGSVKLLVEPDPGGAEGWVRFNITDTGIGIDPDKTEMIFERFTQADSSTTRKYGGTGLGLAISKGLAGLMGGRVGCTSEPGIGSTFFFSAHFDIPGPEAVRPAMVISPVTAAAPRPGSRILIVEDSHFNVVLVLAYLKNNGFVLEVAENGKIALDKVKSGNFDLVLMDLEMPVMGGLESTRLMRQWEMETQRRPMPILALTAHALGEDRGNSLAAGCTEHLTKPIKKATLLEAIARHITRKIRITPPDGIEELVPAYLKNVRRDIRIILAGVEVNDCKTARLLGHQFKGSGEGYGFPEITLTGAAVEKAAMALNVDEIRSQILALAAYLDSVEVRSLEPEPLAL